MIRCKECGEDKDRCDCIGDRGRTFVTRLMIAITAIAMIFGATSCNVEKRAGNNFYRALRLDKPTVYNECGKIAPPVDKEFEKTGYKQGIEEPEIQYVYADCDSFLKAMNSLQNSNSSGMPDSSKQNAKNARIKIPCPPCKPRVDTFFKYNIKTVVNRATEYAQAETIKDQGETIAKQAQSIKIWRAAALGAIMLIVLSIVFKIFRK